ncbi:MAG: sigma 54-dependent Fis family transcriptional regulator [Polyangiaceae bacterium]|nr:sigma 54-dependent Fis family transcriptional regulator [Polyangiaceae bacterium]MCE7892265.1 FHA domain-containing protein [Sorangiineae bacterium PRO1]MCL4749910.1 sigma 54-interacting transcriptional regulator [Myxococcales bacterium]
MASDRTVPIEQTGRLVRTLRVEVVTGPDAGRKLVSGSDSISVGGADGNDLVVTDKTVSRFHLELRRRAGRILAVDLGSTNGTRIGGVVLQAGSAVVDPTTVLSLGATSLRVDDGDIVDVGETPARFGELFGDSAPMRRLMAQASRVAASDVSVLLLGESGTGKELIARALHDTSQRAAEPFVTVDCGAITPTLFSSELFGHERGAFTGAERQHIGAFERAHGGTLFLDEIGELPPELQSALLGALERRRIRRVGGKDDVAVDVRLVSATHRDLRAQVNSATFRLDLFYRVAVVTLSVPPLRERTEDIPGLVEHFLREAGHRGPLREVFPTDELRRLGAHPWPGNVRELRNFVLGTLALGEPAQLQAPALGAGEEARDPFAGVMGLPYRDAKRVVMDDFERRYVEQLLQKSGGNVRQAARDGQMDRSYLMELVKRHRLR